VFDALLQTLRSALATGLSQVFMWTAVTAAAALVVAALLPQHELRGEDVPVRRTSVARRMSSARFDPSNGCWQVLSALAAKAAVRFTLLLDGSG